MARYQGNAMRGTLLIPNWNLTYPGKIPLETVNVEMDHEYRDGIPVWRVWYGHFETWHSVPFDLATWLMVESDRPDRQLLGKVQITQHRGQGKDQPFLISFEGTGELYLSAQLANG